jgi:CBS domain-containing protein
MSAAPSAPKGPSVPISSLMQRQVRFVSMDDTVQEVEERMLREGLAWVPVVEADAATVIGVISAHDLLRFRAEGRDAEGLKAWQLCTYKPIAVLPDTPLEEVAALMLERQVHHVVVMRGSVMEGVVSALDFVRAFVADVPGRPPDA